MRTTVSDWVAAHVRGVGVLALVLAAALAMVPPGSTALETLSAQDDEIAGLHLEERRGSAAAPVPPERGDDLLSAVKTNYDLASTNHANYQRMWLVLAFGLVGAYCVGRGRTQRP